MARLAPALVAMVVLLAPSAALAEAAPLDGTPDPGFGTGGATVTAFPMGAAKADDVAIAPDGDVVAAGGVLNGSADANFAVARYLPDGSLDPGFGTGGLVASDYQGADERANAVLVQPDGKPIVAGWAQGSALPVLPKSYEFAVTRYNLDGSLDQGFGTGGWAVADFLTDLDTSAMAEAVALQPDGRIVLVGTANGPLHNHIALARFNGDGTLDTSFGGDGKVVVDVPNLNSSATAAALQPDGNIVVAGNAFASGSSATSIVIARLRPDGSLDTSFGSQGIVVQSFPQWLGFLTDAVTLEPGGGIVAGGSVFTSAQQKPRYLSLARFSAAGELDPSFGDQGIVVTMTPDEYIGEICALTTDRAGRLLAAGVLVSVDQGNVYLGRYEPDGSLDPAFGSGGYVATDLSGGDEDVARGVALQQDGRIVVGGFAAATSFAVVRYLP